MLAIFFALISFFGWGTGDIFGTIASRKLGGYSVAFWSYLIALIILAPLIPFQIHALQNVTFGILVLTIIIAVIAVVGDVALNEGLRIGNASLVGTIAAAYPALAIIFSTIFLGEKITNLQVFAILVIFLGLALSSLNLQSLRRNRIISDPGVPLAVLTMMSWGIYLTFIKISVSKIGWFWPAYLIFLSFPLILLFMRIRKIKLTMPNTNHGLLPLLAAIILLRIAELSYNLALAKGGDIAIIAPISGSYPTLFVVLAFFIFKDPITKQQILGIITTLTGIVLLSIFSV